MIDSNEIQGDFKSPEEKAVTGIREITNDAITLSNQDRLLILKTIEKDFEEGELESILFLVELCPCIDFSQIAEKYENFLLEKYAENLGKGTAGRIMQCFPMLDYKSAL